MITSIVTSTARISVGGARLLTRYSLWATRTVAAAALKPLQHEGEPEAPMQRKARPRTQSRAAHAMDPRMKARAERTRAAETTPPPAEPSDPGIPGRDAPPARPPEPHHALNNPVDEPDPTEWPDPYDRRPDPRAPDPHDPLPIGTVPHTPTGANSTSAPHPAQDPEAEPWKGPKRDKVDK